MKKMWLIFFSFMLITTTLIGCDLVDFLRVEYTLVIEVEGHGTTIPEMGRYSFKEGEVVELKAQPDEGWAFINWAGNVSDKNTPITTIVMNADQVVIALFEEIIPEYTLTIEIDGSGMVEPVKGDHRFPEGTIVLLKAIPDEGWYFKEWVGDVVAKEAIETLVIMDADKTVKAIFKEITSTYFILNLEADPEDGGEVWGRGIYEPGENVDIAACPHHGFRFLHWTKDGEIFTDKRLFTFTMPEEDVTFVAHFQRDEEPNRFSLTLLTDPEEAGEVWGHGFYEPGENVEIGTSPYHDFFFLHWSKDGEIFTDERLFTFTMPEEDVTFVAHFQRDEEPNRFIVTLLTEPEEAGEVWGHGFYEPGENVEIGTSPYNDFYFLYWTEDGDFYTDERLFTFTMPEEDVTFVAHFQ